MLAERSSSPPLRIGGLVDADGIATVALSGELDLSGVERVDDCLRGRGR
jgi:hypothetical protein